MLVLLPHFEITTLEPSLLHLSGERFRAVLYNWKLFPSSKSPAMGSDRHHRAVSRILPLKE